MIKSAIEKYKRHKFVRDVGLNSVSTAGVAVTVLAINTVVGRFYGAEALGLYNAALATFVIASMISVFGISQSILKKCAEHEVKSEAFNRVALSGLLSVMVISLVFVFGLYTLLRSGLFSEDSRIQSALLVMLPAIWFACFNKCCRAVFNGVRDMAACSLMDLVRWSGILIFLAWGIRSGQPVEFLFRAFLYVEFMLSIACLCRLTKYVGRTKGLSWGDFLNHLRFGSKVFFGSSLLALNDRAAVLLLVAFLPYREVGIFSFAFEFAKGLLAFTQVIQMNFNPIISRRSALREFDGLLSDIKRIQRVVDKLVVAISLTAAVGFPAYIFLLMEGGFYQSLGVFYILLIGVSFALMYFWMGSLLTMTGRPGDSFWRNLIYLACTVVFNLILIPLLGIYGAALATSATYFVRILTLRIFVARRLGIVIG